jgi:oligopeptide transport system substrate-binding protein
LIFPDDPFTLDPGLSTITESNNVITHLFSGLLEYTPQMDVVPDLAHRWEILEGGCKYVFHLQEEAHWSDGAPLTAHDFVYAWTRLLNPAAKSLAANLLYDIKGARAFHLGETSETESLGIRASDPYILEVELEAPAGYFLQLMAHTVAYPIPRHVVELLGEAWTEVGNIIGNGPYLLESWEHGKSIYLVRNPEYHGRFSGNLQQVEIAIHPGLELGVWLSMYDANELDVMDITFFPPAEMKRLRYQRPSESISTPSQNVFFMVFNTSKAPFDDPRVRRAFMMALDRVARSRAVSGGTAIPAMGGLIPPGIPGHSPEIGLPYDLEGAQELMAQAGYPGGRGFPLVEVLLWPGAEVQIENTMFRWQEVLGVEITWDFAPIIDVPERAKVKPPHMIFLGWGADYPDPDNILRVGFRKSLSGWQGKAFESLIESARRTQDQEERIILYQKADRMLIDEAIVLPLAYHMTHLLVKPWVKNYPPMERWFLKDVIIEPH